MGKIKKSQLQMDTETYVKLAKMRKTIPCRGPSGFRLEPVRNVVKRLLDFYIENGGEIPDSK